MTKKLMELGKRKKKKEKWHDAIGDASSAGATVWPARAVEREKVGDNEGEDNTLGQRHPVHARATNGAMIDFAEALQDSSTLYGVSVRKSLDFSPTPFGNRSAWCRVV